MALANYADLIAAIPTWANRTDLTARLPEFVSLAEARMASDLTTRALETVQTVAITAGVASLPADVQSVRGVKVVGARIPAVKITSEERLEDLETSLYQGEPTYGAFVGRTIVTYPAITGTLQVRGKCRVPPLQTNSTNWVMTNYPNVYLFGCLIEVAAYLRDEAGARGWEARYGQAVSQANDAFNYQGQAAMSSVRGVV